MRYRMARITCTCPGIGEAAMDMFFNFVHLIMNVEALSLIVVVIVLLPVAIAIFLRGRRQRGA